MVGVSGTVGVTAGSVGNVVAPGVGVLCRGPDVAVLVGTPFFSWFPVASFRAVFPCASVGLVRHGLGGKVGVTTTGTVAPEGGAVAVINVALVTAVASPCGRPCASSDPQTLPTVTKSRDILIQRQKKVTSITSKRPPMPRFHRAINVSIISLLSFPQIFS